MSLTIQENLQAAEKLMIQGKTKQACLLLEQLSTENPDNITIQTLTARSYLALGNTEQAYKIYTPLSIASRPEYAEARPEALLALGKYKAALHDYEAYFKRSGEVLFLAALAAYKCGVIVKARLLLKQAVSRQYEWNENTLADALVLHVLPGFEFMDFEQLYLDAVEQVENPTNNYNNRWMSISIPVFEFLQNPAQKKQNMSQLLNLLGTTEFTAVFENGKTELENMLQEMTDLETDARFGLEALKLLQENKYSALAGLLMALLLEQTSRDCALFGLDQKFIKSSQLQQLLVALPLGIATALLLLFSIANPLEQHHEQIQKMDENIVTGLLVLCVVTCNREIKKLQN